MAARLIRLEWVEQIDLTNMPNKVANMQDVYKGVSFDPTDDHHAPWQSGMTGLGYDNAVTGELTSLDVALGSQREVEGQGHVPDRDARHGRPDDAQARQGPDAGDAQPSVDAAIAEIQKAIDGRHRPGVHGQRRTPRTWSRGNVVLAMAWSGDIVTPQAGREGDARLAPPDEGGMLWTDNMLHPEGRPAQVHGRADHRLRLRPGDRGPDRGVRQLRDARSRAPRRSSRTIDPDIADEPADLPAGRRPGDGQHLQEPDRGATRRTSTSSSRPSSAAGSRRERGDASRWARGSGVRRLTPYLLLAPGILWLLVFYVYPAIQMFISSFWTGTLETGFTFSLLNWTTYTEALDRYSAAVPPIARVRRAATVICFLIAYPLAYAIAFRGGRYKNLLLFLVIAPFFTSFLLRTQSAGRSSSATTGSCSGR